MTQDTNINLRNGVEVTYAPETTKDGKVTIEAHVVSTLHAKIGEKFEKRIKATFVDDTRNRGIFMDDVNREISYMSFLAGSMGDRVKFAHKRWIPNCMLPTVIGNQSRIVDLLTFNTGKTRPYEGPLGEEKEEEDKPAKSKR